MCIYIYIYMYIHIYVCIGMGSLPFFPSLTSLASSLCLAANNMYMYV